MTTPSAPTFPRAEADERPAPLTAVGMGVQSALLAIAPIALIPILFTQAAGSDEAFASWIVFAMLVINGAATILQAYRIRFFGAGLFIVPYPSPTVIPFCILALQEGGVGVLASLILVSGLFHVVLSLRLSLLRRIVTPAVSGAILILLMITLVPVLFGNLGNVPSDAPDAAGPVAMLVTFAVILGLLLRGASARRAWASVVGIAAGSIAAAAFGLYDFGPAQNAQVIGIPTGGWPGLGLDFGVTFWSLLPIFLFLSVVIVLQGASITLSTQRVSWRSPRAVDYRRVQGAALATGAANVASGLAAAMPITISPRGVAFAQQTGYASRHIAAITGALIVAVAFFPKVWGLLLGIPDPVISVYLLLLVGPLLVEGMKLILQDTPDYRTSLVVGTAIVIGMGLQTGAVVLPVGSLWSAALEKALTGGGAALIILTVIASFGQRRRRRLHIDLAVEELPRLNDFLERFAAGRGWSAQMTARMQAAAEETILVLREGREADGGASPRRLVIDASADSAGAELEFVCVPADADNIEDRIALLTQPLPGETPLEAPEAETRVERGAGLRLMRHYAASVSHRQYFDTEVVTLRIALP